MQLMPLLCSHVVTRADLCFGSLSCSSHHCPSPMLLEEVRTEDGEHQRRVEVDVEDVEGAHVYASADEE